MELQFTFKNMDSSEALEEVTRRKFDHLLARYEPNPQIFRVTVSSEGRCGKVHVKMVASDGCDIEAEASSINLFASVDDVYHKLDTQLRRRKERAKSRMGGVRRLNNLSSLEISSKRGGRRDVLDSMNSLFDESVWERSVVDAGDILLLSPKMRGPLEPVCAS